MCWALESRTVIIVIAVLAGFVIGIIFVNPVVEAVEGWQAAIEILQLQIDAITAGTPVFFGTNELIPNTRQFVGTSGPCSGNVPDDVLIPICEMVMPFDGTFTRLTLSSASGTTGQSPGSGESYTAILLVNGASTSLSCTISGSDTDCVDSSNNVPVSSLDRIVVKVSSSSAANIARVSSSVVFTP